MNRQYWTLVSGIDHSTAIEVRGEDGALEIRLQGDTVRLDVAAFEKLVRVARVKLSDDHHPADRREWTLANGRPVMSA